MKQIRCGTCCLIFQKKRNTETDPKYCSKKCYTTEIRNSFKRDKIQRQLELKNKAVSPEAKEKWDMFIIYTGAAVLIALFLAARHYFKA